MGTLIDADGTPVHSQAYDTHDNHDEERLLNAHLTEILNHPDLTILVGACDEAVRFLNQDTKDLLTAFGSTQINDVQYRDGWAFIASSSGVFAPIEMHAGTGAND